MGLNLLPVFCHNVALGSLAVRTTVVDLKLAQFGRYGCDINVEMGEAGAAD